MNQQSKNNNLDILDIAQKYLKLTKKGKYFTSLCPFHQEKKPSFYISPEMQIFKCFGCGESGNAIKLLMKLENIDYRQAITLLKNEFNIDYQKYKTKQVLSPEMKLLIEMNYAALKFFKQQLRQNQEAIDYLISRGINQETIDEFELGFAPGGNLLRDYLHSLGYELKDIKKNGLVDEQHNDRFQSRIIFPLKDENFRLIGFTGRLFKKNFGPKYLNTPDTPLFSKSSFLYGLSYAKDYILQTKKVIMVEGQFDFLLSWVNNYKNTVAISGSALTENHLRKLSRYCQTIVFAFDNDESGFKATLRANILARQLGMETYQLNYDAKDLGEYFLEKKQPLTETKFTDFLIDFLVNKYNHQYEKILPILLPHIKVLKPLESHQYLDKISKEFGIPKNILEKEINDIIINNYPSPLASEPSSQPIIDQVPNINVESALIDSLSLKIINLIYAFGKTDNIDIAKIKKIIPKKFKKLFNNIISNNLDDENKPYFEMAKDYYQQQKINYQREITKSVNYLEKLIIKNKIKILNNKLENINNNNRDKIIKTIKNLVEQLKIIEKNNA
ncbi:MAG: DNA primase [Candidatus Parcubacteria bacterium]|nr:MAG: DNA primase [Candidatus Parcubacteria bacterium]